MAEDRGEFAPVPRHAMPGAAMFCDGFDADIAQDRWPNHEPLPALAPRGRVAVGGTLS
jgi:hypothetical protein